MCKLGNLNAVRTERGGGSSVRLVADLIQKVSSLLFSCYQLLCFPLCVPQNNNCRENTNKLNCVSLQTDALKPVISNSDILTLLLPSNLLTSFMFGVNLASFGRLFDGFNGIFCYLWHFELNVIFVINNSGMHYVQGTFDREGNDWIHCCELEIMSSALPYFSVIKVYDMGENMEYTLTGHLISYTC